MHIHDVQVHTGENRRSNFECPNCHTTIRFTNAYPLSFQWKVCPECRWQWVPMAGGIGPHADEIAGETNTLRVFSSGISVDAFG